MRFLKTTALAAWFVLALSIGSLTGHGLGDYRWSTASAASFDQASCETPGLWLDPATGNELGLPGLMKKLHTRRIVLLGESHTQPEHHRWQLHMLAALSAHAAELIIGFEMFPRSVQTTLDRWSAGELTEEDFLRQSRWSEVWGYAPEAYLPMFHFARQNRIPMIALNVERSLISRIGREGWGAISNEDREGLSDPAPAHEAYRQSLAEVFRMKLQRGHGLSSVHGGGDGGEARNAALPGIVEILERDDFQRFVEAQTAWDRAMAEGLFEAGRASSEAMVVGIMGRGHMEHRHGVPHQLAELGENDVAVLLPVEIGEACKAVTPGLADAVFLVQPSEDVKEKEPKPRLGVMIETVEAGVRIVEVVPGSVAEASGLIPGDVIARAADVSVGSNSQLVEIILRQAPGTWLPLDIRREDEERQIVAKFPSWPE